MKNWLGRGPWAHLVAFNLCKPGNPGIDGGKNDKSLKPCRQGHSIEAFVNVTRPSKNLGPGRLRGPEGSGGGETGGKRGKR